MKKMNNKGFSLVELIIVIAIMAVLMGVLAPQFLKYVEQSRQQSDLTSFSEVENAAKVALAQEDIYKACLSGAKVTIATGSIGGSPEALINELKLVVDEGEIKLSSKQYGDGTEITIKFDSTKGMYTLDCPWKEAATPSGD